MEKHDHPTARQRLGDLEAGLKTANAIGDDTLQRQSTDSDNQESFTHGSAAQRSATPWPAQQRRAARKAAKGQRPGEAAVAVGRGRARRGKAGAHGAPKGGRRRAASGGGRGSGRCRRGCGSGRLFAE